MSKVGEIDSARGSPRHRLCAGGSWAGCHSSAGSRGRETFTKEDFEREVTRLLENDTHFAGPVDPSLNGKNMRTHESKHPKQVRFFREFLGTPTREDF